MTMVYTYSPVAQEALLCPLGSHLEGFGLLSKIRWDRLDCTDCVWIVPSTKDGQP